MITIDERDLKGMSDLAAYRGMSDLATIIVKMFAENQELKADIKTLNNAYDSLNAMYSRLKEDKEENEATYERTIARYKKELNERRKKDAQ